MFRSGLEAAIFTGMPVVMTSASYKRFGLIVHQSELEGTTTVDTQWDASGIVVLSSCGIYFCGLSGLSKNETVNRDKTERSLSELNRMIRVSIIIKFCIKQTSQKFAVAFRYR
jgi:hypothetical protein